MPQDTPTLESASSPVTETDASDKLWHVAETYGVPAMTVLIIILVAIVVAGWVSRLVTKSCDKAKIDPTLTKFFAKTARWAVLLIASLIGLGSKAFCN